MVLSLTGCIPAAFVIGATAGGAIVYDKRNMSTILQDHNSAVTAQNRIDSDPELKGRSHISVAVFNHVGLMVGQAQTSKLRDRAYQIVTNVKNISRIYNEVTVAGATSVLQHSNDALLTAKVKTAMLAKSGLHSTQIKVVTEDNVVYLMGEVSPQQASLATDIARRVAGVEKVVKVFEYV